MFIRCFLICQNFLLGLCQQQERCFSDKSAEEIYQLKEQMAILNEQQIFAEDNILDGHNIVLTGQAKTGKTFLLKDKTA